MIKNASTLPKVYYGLHMVEGVAEYREPGAEPYRICIFENAIKSMDPTFSGRPVYVEHVDEVNLTDLEKEMDGVVVESFYNKADGKHWAKFVITTDKGHEAIAKGWKLSNAYVPKTFAGGGLWHGVEYKNEVTAGEYEHLAIVPNPRYEESVILTPEQFKAYNETKEVELKKFANSKEKHEGERKMKFNFWKKTQVENADGLEGMSVTLPKSKKEVTIEKLINDADEATVKNMSGYANGDHMVKVGEEEMSVNDLTKKYSEMKSSMENSSKEEEEKKANADADKDKKENADEEDKEKKENADEDEKKENEDDGDEYEDSADKKKNSHFDALKNAHHDSLASEVQTVELSYDKLARGKARYGSSK